MAVTGSAARKPRKFSSEIATRGKTPLIVSLIGPSGSGKTFSALRLATGMQRERGGEIFFVDTESLRGRHYADRFKFRHVPFEAPFGSRDYLDAIQYCASSGAGVIVIDSMSHEHDGPGGMLDFRDEEWTKLGRRGETSLLSWGEPKKARKELLTGMVQLNLAFVLSFRAKEKIKPAPKGAKSNAPEKLGWQPITGAEFQYEATVQLPLPPGSDGVPMCFPDEPAAQRVVKVPTQFRELLMTGKHQLSEDIGQALGRWSCGGAPPAGIAAGPIDQVIMALETCSIPEELEAIRTQALPIFQKASTGDRRRMSEALNGAKERVLSISDAFASRRPSQPVDDDRDPDPSDDEPEDVPT